MTTATTLLDEPKQVPEQKQASLETGDGCFELHYDYSGAKNFSIPNLVNAFFRSYSTPHPEKIPIITNVKHLSKDKVEVTRKILFKDFHNNTDDLPEEVIVINRANLGVKGSVVLQSLATYPGLKQEALKVFSVGYTVQRCLLQRDACSAFRDVSKLQMFSDVYMYKQLQMCKRVLALVED